MPWVRIEEEFYLHPKVLRVGPYGMAMQIAALCYANKLRTNGFIPEEAPAVLLDFDGCTQDGEPVYSERIVGDLVAAGMWERVERGWRIHDYDDYQPSREQVEDKHGKKVRAGREGGVKSAQVRAAKKQTRTTSEADAKQNGSKREAKTKPETVTVTKTVSTEVLASTGSSLPSPSGELTLVAQQARPVSVDRLVFEAWQQATGKTRAKLDDKRRRVIARALKAFPLDDVLDAVRGWQHDPWTERPRYNDLGQLLRDADHIEKFRDLWRDGPPAPVLAPRQQQQRDQLIATHRELQAWAKEVDGHAGNPMDDDHRPAQRQLPRQGTAG
jgi:hypothetical protein